VLLPLRLFRNKVANLGLGTQTIQWLILQGSFFTVSVYLQEVNHYSPIQTGLILTPATIGILAASAAADRFARRHPQRWPIIAGFRNPYRDAGHGRHGDTRRAIRDGWPGGPTGLRGQLVTEGHDGLVNTT
jgi:hypothetical protein